MLHDRINAEIIKSCNDFYQNPWFLVKKRSEKYWIVNITMNMNKYTVQDALLSLNVDDFAEKFAEMLIMSLIDFFSDYDQIELDPESRDMTVFQTSLSLF